MARERSSHGTAMNDTSSQTVRQRERYETTFGNNNLGRKFNFNLFSQLNPQEIMITAIETMNKFTFKAGDNPDFPNELNDGNLNTFVRGNMKFNDLGSAEDKPFKLGPNISVPPIDSPTTPNGLQSSSPVNATGDTVGESGYGTFIDRNDVTSNSPVRTSYLQRRGTRASNNGYTRGTNNKLGEYLDSTAYEYTE